MFQGLEHVQPGLVSEAAGPSAILLTLRPGDLGGDIGARAECVIGGWTNVW